MSSITIVRESDIIRTPRIMQLEGIFDVPPSKRSKEEWSVNLVLPEQWNVGVIVGPSGSGKTTVARHIFGDDMIGGWEWPMDKSIVDGFPADMSIKDIVALLSSVGFSSPPSWVRPFRVLSNGEQFRVMIARTLAEKPALAVVDEFTSVVDRTVAQIGSAAIAKTVRRRNQKFIAVSCHYDILDWLEPDWVYEPHTDNFYNGRYLHQRPRINLSIKRVHHSAWRLFRKHHYLDTELNKAAACFVAFWEGVPVAFTGAQAMPHPNIKNLWREHRTVCLPDYQGVGIGNAMSDYIASVMAGLGKHYNSVTSHPAMIRSRNLSSNWRIVGKTKIGAPKTTTGTLGGKEWKPDKINKRIAYTFRYIGPPLESGEARRIWAA